MLHNRMAKQVTGMKREANQGDVEAGAKPTKISRDSNAYFTKAVIICNAAELSKSGGKTFRPNNIVVELLKRSPMKYGKVTFSRSASEDGIREDLCRRFPILKNKRLSLASADQYGKLNFHQSEKWTGYNVRRWLPGSSALYVTFEGDDEIHESMSHRDLPSGSSHLTMRSSLNNVSISSSRSNRSHHSLLDILSSTNTTIIDPTKRIMIDSLAKSRALPRSRSFPTFSTSSSLSVTKEEQINAHSDFKKSCGQLSSFDSNNCKSSRNISTASSSSAALDSQASLGKRQILSASCSNVKLRKPSDASSEHSHTIKDKLVVKVDTQVESFDSQILTTSEVLQSKRLLDGASDMGAEKGTDDRSQSYKDTHSSSNNMKQGLFFKDLRNETTVRLGMTEKSAPTHCDHFLNITMMDNRSATGQQNFPSDEIQSDSNNAWITSKNANNFNTDNGFPPDRNIIDNSIVKNRDAFKQPFLTPLRMSKTSCIPKLCAPSNETFPWKRKQESSNYITQANVIASQMLEPSNKEVNCCGDIERNSLEEHEIIPSSGTFKGGDTFVILVKEPIDEQVVVLFGESEASEVTLKNPYAIKGQTPESTNVGPISVTIATKDGEMIGQAVFTYVGDFFDKVKYSETEELNHKEVSGNTPQLSQKLLDAQNVEEQILNPLPVTYNDKRCCSERGDDCKDDSLESDKRIVDNDDSTDRLIEEDNLLLLSSIASNMKDDSITITNRTAKSSQSSKPSKKTKRHETRSESASFCGFYKKVLILPSNSLYLPSQSDLCKLRMSRECYCKVFFHGAMTRDDVMDQIGKAFPNLKDLRLKLAVVDQTGKLAFHDQMWTGQSVRKKLRGNSVLYVAPVD